MRHRIFVPLEGAAGPLREVEAVAAGDGQFRLVGAPPRDGPTKFRRGEIVECEIRALPNGKKGLVAFRSVSADPEFRKRRNVFAVFGAIVGGILGAPALLCIEMSARSAAAGFMLGAVIFSFCSARWGDAAWDVLSRMFENE